MEWLKAVRIVDHYFGYGNTSDCLVESVVLRSDMGMMRYGESMFIVKKKMALQFFSGVYRLYECRCDKLQDV